MTSMRLRYLFFFAALLAIAMYRNHSKVHDLKETSQETENTPAQKVTSQHSNTPLAKKLIAVNQAPEVKTPDAQAKEEDYENPLYKDPEKYADPEMVRQRDDEERDLHELQHSVEVKPVDPDDLK